MGELPRSTSPPVKPADDRLDSWKEIATHLKRDVTTVQRWEKREGMPVHRHVHDRLGSVYALRSELDAWARSRNLSASEESKADPTSSVSPVQTPAPAPPAPAPSRTRSRLAIFLFTAVAVLAAGAILWWQRTEHFWRSPIADARFQTITDFERVAQAAAISRDGRFVAFLSDRDGGMDVWVTQLGSGQFHNLTQGSIPDLVNPAIRSLGFSPDGSVVTFWLRKQEGANGGKISIWAVPILGGSAKPYLDGAAELDWSADGSRLVYHTPGPGDPLFVSDGTRRQEERPIFTAPVGLHSHFPVWAPDSAFIYFVQGSLPDKLDVWRIRPSGGTPERITAHATRVSHPVLLDRRTLLYLASDPDGSGPWVYSMDVERRIPHRLTEGLDCYTSLAASADGRRVVATLANPKRTLWRMPLPDKDRDVEEPVRISLPTSAAFSPRFGPDYMLYVASTGSSESIRKLANGTDSELWRAQDAQVVGAPAVSRDGKFIAFSVRGHGKTELYMMQADGTNLRMVTDALELQGSPAWAPDNRSITTAANDRGLPHLYSVPLDGAGTPTVLVQEHSLDPAWDPRGHFVLYSGPDIGTTFQLEAATANGAVPPLPDLTLTRGARHVVFLRGEQAIVVLRGEIQHKDLWLIDLATGAQSQLTHFHPNFDVRDFDISPDGRELVLERGQERSEVVLMDLARR